MPIPTSPDRFSYFLKTIHNIIPCRTISLETVYHFISLGYLRSVTQRVKSGTLKKYLALPFITPAAVFQKRSMEHIRSYSGIIPVELDHVNINLKEQLFEDPFLNPKLVCVNPFKTGLKLFIKVKNPSAEHHDHYFNAISVYLQAKYELEPGSSSRDLYRPCYLSYDPDALYSSSGSVDSETLLNTIPPMPCTDEQLYITPRKDLPLYNFLQHPLDLRLHDRTTARGDEDTTARDEDTTARLHENSASSLQPKAYSLKPFPNFQLYLYNQLNTFPSVHLRAVWLLKRHGWTRIGKYWYQPGKNHKESHSAVFARFAPYGIFLFTNFSNSTGPFSLPNKSYSDCMIIAVLAPDLWKKMIHKYTQIPHK